MAAAAGQPPAADLLAQVHGQTEGNPLFVKEMIRFLVQEGIARRRSPRGRSAFRRRSASHPGRGEGGDRHAPQPAVARVQRGARPCRGDRAPLHPRVLARLLESLSEDQRTAALEEALAASVIEALDGPGRYQFSHALIRETLYDEVPAVRRTGLHLRIGVALEDAPSRRSHAAAFGPRAPFLRRAARRGRRQGDRVRPPRR